MLYLTTFINKKNGYPGIKGCKVFSQRHFPNLATFQILQFPKQQLPKEKVRPSEAPQAAMGAERCH